MSPRPVIFISAVSEELGNARALVASALRSMGCEPVWMTAADADPATLRQRMRQRIQSANAVLQLVGHTYGPETAESDPATGRCSDAQLEALLAEQCWKKVSYLDIKIGPLTDPHPPEPEELRALQAAYRKRLEAQSLLMRRVSTAKMLDAYTIEIFQSFRQSARVPVRNSRAGPSGASSQSPERKSSSIHLVLQVLVALVLVAGIIWAMVQHHKDSPQAQDDADTRPANAEELMREFLKKQPSRKPKANPVEVLVLRHAVAADLARAGDAPGAEREYRAILTDAQRILGPEHPETLHLHEDLAGVLETLGRQAEAERERKAALALHQHAQDPERPSTLGTRSQRNPR